MLVALRAQKTYSDRCHSHSCGSVESVEALRVLNIHMDPHPEWGIYEDWSFKAVIANIKDAGTVGVLFMGDHAVEVYVDD